MDELLQSADTGILLTSPDCLWSGVAYGNNLYFPLGAVDQYYALNEHTVGHELAHLFGAHHNRIDAKRHFYPYGFGKLFKKGATTNSGYRTIMG